MREKTSAPTGMAEGSSTLSRGAPLRAVDVARPPGARRGVKLAWVVAFIVAVFTTLLLAVGAALVRHFDGEAQRRGPVGGWTLATPAATAS